MAAPAAARFARRAAAPAGALAAGLLAAWLLWPAGPLIEIDPARSVRVRSPAIKAYEDAWWASLMDHMRRLCLSLQPTAQASYGFAVLVDAKGRILRADVGADSFDLTLAPRIEQAVRAASLPAFTAQQESEKKTLILRGKLLIDEGKCRLQRT